MQSDLSSKPISKSRIARIAQALKRLVADKEDTKQVFLILEATGEGAAKRSFKRFSQHPNAPTILQAKKSLLDHLSDRDWLKTLPVGSLGQHYYDFTARENITADGLVEASEEGRYNERELSEEQVVFHTRVRDAHDLWHVTTGYGRDPLGELSLLAFTYRQLGNYGLLLIIGIGLIIMRREAPNVRAWPAILEGFRMGKRANWLGAADWERLLTLPIETVRAELSIGKPDSYRQTVQKIQAQIVAAE